MNMCMEPTMLLNQCIFRVQLFTTGSGGRIGLLGIRLGIGDIILHIGTTTIVG